MSKWFVELRTGIYVDAETRDEARKRVFDWAERQSALVDLDIVDSYKISQMGSNEAAARGLDGTAAEIL